MKKKELKAMLDALKVECDKLRYERDYNSAMWVDMKLERDKFVLANKGLVHDRSMAEAEVERITAERDALQARIDAGVQLCSQYGVGWTSARHPSDTMTGLLIDVQPIEQGDNKKRFRSLDELMGIDLPINAVGPKELKPAPIVADALPDERKGDRRVKRDHKMALQNNFRRADTTLQNERRRTPGTRADRKQATREVDAWVDENGFPHD